MILAAGPKQNRCVTTAPGRCAADISAPFYALCCSDCVRGAVSSGEAGREEKIVMNEEVGTASDSTAAGKSPMRSYLFPGGSRKRQSYSGRRYQGSSFGDPRDEPPISHAF